MWSQIRRMKSRGPTRAEQGQKQEKNKKAGEEEVPGYGVLQPQCISVID